MGSWFHLPSIYLGDALFTSQLHVRFPVAVCALAGDAGAGQRHLLAAEPDEPCADAAPLHDARAETRAALLALDHIRTGEILLHVYHGVRFLFIMSIHFGQKRVVLCASVFLPSSKILRGCPNSQCALPAVRGISTPPFSCINRLC